MTINVKTALMSTALATTLTMLGGAAHAQKSINVTFISGLPPVTTVVGAAVDAFVPTIDETLAKSGKYKINWNLAHSGQIVKPRGELEALESGLGDVGIVVTAFHADKAPLYEIAYKTPFTTQDLDLVARTVKQLQDQFPEFQAGWKRFNQMSLHPTGTVENYVLISAKPILTLDDIKGRKIGAAGPNLPWVLAVGAAGVQTNVGSAYNSLSTGIFDNMLAWKQAMGAFKLCEPAPYMIDPQLGAVQTGGLNVNLFKRVIADLIGAKPPIEPVWLAFGFLLSFLVSWFYIPAALDTLSNLPTAWIGVCEPPSETQAAIARSPSVAGMSGNRVTAV